MLFNIDFQWLDQSGEMKEQTYRDVRESDVPSLIHGFLNSMWKGKNVIIYQEG